MRSCRPTSCKNTRITNAKSEQKGEMERNVGKNDLIWIKEFGCKGKTTNIPTCMTQHLALCVFWIMPPGKEILKFWSLPASTVIRNSTLSMPCYWSEEARKSVMLALKLMSLHHSCT
jgi:hypothetical protein